MVNINRTLSSAKTTSVLVVVVEAQLRFSLFTLRTVVLMNVRNNTFNTF